LIKVVKLTFKGRVQCFSCRL